MADNPEKQAGSAGRPRGYSLLSAQLQAQGDKVQATPSPDRGRGRLLSETGRIFAGLALDDDLDLRLSESMNTFFETDSDPFAGPDSVVSSEPIGIKAKTNHLQDLTSSDEDILSAGKKSEELLRKWCQGQPPKQSFLSSDFLSSPRSRAPRRSTIADKVELDSVLHTAMVNYSGLYYLPVNAHTVHHLSRHTNGAKPVADKTIFSMLLINGEINNIYAEHVVAALESIGEHVKDLVIIAPIHTTEFGDAFKRDCLHINTGSDWENILKQFPNLQSLTFEHPTNLPTELTRETFCAIHRALANGILPQLKNVHLNVPTKVFTNLRMDVHDHHSNGGPPASGTSPLLVRAEEAAYDEEAIELGI